MARIKMTRIDYRMVHGQIVAKWIKFRPVDRLILADDPLVDDYRNGLSSLLRCCSIIQ